VRGELADVERVEPLWRELVAFHERTVEPRWPVREAAEAWRRRRAQYQEWVSQTSGWLLLAVADGDPGEPPDGYALVRILVPGPTWKLGERIGELETLVVAERARGAGVGTSLIAAARELVGEHGIEYWSVGVVESNRGAVALYEREGFRPHYLQMLAPLEPQAPPADGRLRTTSPRDGPIFP
jgi:ribosomal protein S18 acetylase RimI-like enzyme